MPIDVNAVNAAIQQNGARWTAAENYLTGLDRDQLRRRGGGARRRRGHLPPAGTPFAAGEQTPLPPSVDWRNMNGNNYISAVKKQGDCASSVAFGVGAAIDAAMRIKYDLPVNHPNSSMLADVSEGQLFYCVPEQSCQEGGYVDDTLAYAKDTGIVPDYLYPYTAGDQVCRIPGIANWQQYITQISGSSYLTSHEEKKKYLATTGPLIAVVKAYEDFFAYRDGVYSHVWGELLTDQCLCVIGYSDSRQAWLCKNSLGADWNGDGFVWIKYDEASLDKEMYYPEGFTKIYPVMHYPGWLTIAHQGGNDNGQLWYVQTDTSTSVPDLRIPDAGMSNGPGMALYNGELYIAHGGADRSGQLWYTVFDGTWSQDKLVPNVAVSSGPALAVYNGRLYCVHQGGRDSGELWYTYFDGTTWAKDKLVPGIALSSRPALAVYEGRLYCAHQGGNNNGELWYTSFDGTTWANDTRVPGISMSIGPALAVYNDRLYCAHQGGRENGELRYTSFDGATWASDRVVPNVAMSDGPALTVYNGKLYCAHQGGGQNGQLWYTSYDGTTWAKDKLVPNVGMSASPAIIAW